MLLRFLCVLDLMNMEVLSLRRSLSFLHAQLWSAFSAVPNQLPVAQCLFPVLSYGLRLLSIINLLTHPSPTLSPIPPI